jgi:diaminopimelate decarboxylase
MKALSNVSVLKLLKTQGSGLDTVHKKYNWVCMLVYSRKNNIFTPNGVSFEEIEEVAHLGVQINIDNFRF